MARVRDHGCVCCWVFSGGRVMRRFLSAMLVFCFLSQSSGGLAQARDGFALGSGGLTMAQATLAWFRGTRTAAVLTGNETRWEAMHAPPPVFHRGPLPKIVLPGRYVRRVPILHYGVRRAGPHMLGRRLRPDQAPKDPRAMSHGASAPRRCASFATHIPCAQRPLMPTHPLLSFTPYAPRGPTRMRIPVSGGRTMAMTPTVQPFQYEADTMSGPVLLFDTTGGESGAKSQIMDSAPANPSASESLTYPTSDQSDSFGWISPANVPYSTSWPAQTYTVTLNVASPNSSLEITAVDIYRVDSNGGPGTSGLALVGSLRSEERRV